MVCNESYKITDFKISKYIQDFLSHSLESVQDFRVVYNPLAIVNVCVVDDRDW